MDTALEVSRTHMVQTETGLVKAADVKVGDSLITENGSSRVISIKKVKRTGAYGPVTNTGDIIVNKVVASNYVVQPALDTLFSSTAQHYLQHYALAPYRIFCNTFGCKDETYNEEGFSAPSAMWMLVLNFLESHPIALSPTFHLAAAFTTFVAWKNQAKLGII